MSDYIRRKAEDLIRAAYKSNEGAYAVIASVIEDCAQEAFSFDIDWSVGFAENLGKVGLAIPVLAASPPEPVPAVTAATDGWSCVRPEGCFRPACIAEKRCRMDPNHPRFHTSPPVSR